MIKVVTSFQDLPASQGRVVCLGNFDGFHLGHQKIVKECLAEAKKLGLQAMPFSFDPHPRKFLTKGRQPKLLMTREEKLEAFERLGFDTLLLQSFSEDFSKISPQDFISEVLLKHLNAKVIVVGKDFRFGYRGLGKIEDFVKAGLKVQAQEEVVQNQQKISSSWVRRLLELGDVREASEALGYPYFLSGQVVHGDNRGGSKLGFPTINIDTKKECMPGNGVYLSMLQDRDTGLFFPSVTNIGERPTVDDSRDIRVETHLIHVKDDFYEREVRLSLICKLREEIKFESFQALQSQIQSDVDRAVELFQNMQFLQKDLPTMQWSLASAPDAAQSFQAFVILSDL